MAVGKGSMARASKAIKSTEGKEMTITASKAKSLKATARVMGAASEQVMSKIVYQESMQMLNRDAKPGETFAVGDAMPVYYF